MISHDNVCWIARTMINELNLQVGKERLVSYLPLSHIAAQDLDLYLPLFIAAHVTFARPDALKGSLKNTLLICRPTIFFGVPRVWEKFREGMLLKGKSNSWLKKRVAKIAKKIGTKATRAKELKEDMPFMYNLANKKVFSKVKEALGLDECKLFFTGAAPIPDFVLDYFSSLDIQIMNLYGASECTGPATFNKVDKFRMYVYVPVSKTEFKSRMSCGRAFKGEELKLSDVDIHENGEIIWKGRHVFMGYINKREATCDVFDSNGFYHSGDKGYLNMNGFLSITGRFKEILITKGGENVAPVFIEDNIKRELPDIVSNVVVIGDEQKYLTCLITLKTVVKDDVVTRKLDPEIVKLIKYETTQEATKSSTLLMIIDDGIKRANEKAISAAQRVKKFRILLDDFTVDTNELTSTLKLKRSVIVDNNKKCIDDMYK